MIMGLSFSVCQDLLTIKFYWSTKVLYSHYIFLKIRLLFSFLGFQTHTTPVLLAQGERAELATEEYLPLTPIMEGFVILRKNPDY